MIHATLLLLALAQTPAAPATAGPPSVYSDGRHIRVVMVPLADGAVLAKFENTGSLVDGRVFKLASEQGSRARGSRARLIYKGDDELRVLLDAEDADPTPYSYALTTARTPTQPVSIYFDREASAKVDAVALHAAAYALGTLAADEVAQVASDAAKACGLSALPFTVGAGKGAAYACADSLAAIGSLCADALAREAIAAKLVDVSCNIDGKTSVTLTGKTLKANFGADEANRFGTVRAALLDQL